MVGEAGSNRALLLAAFVGVPLPGTGAWTGATVAFLVGMPFQQVDPMEARCVRAGTLEAVKRIMRRRGGGGLGAWEASDACCRL